MRLLMFIVVCLLTNPVASQQVAQKKAAPRLIVGLVVDQMRWDYLTRYESRYSNGGFKRIIREGFSFDNTLIPYTPTYTAAGHASIYTGTVPAMNGIIGNTWYSRELGRVVYCTDDSTVTGVGSNSDAGKMSPRNMWSTSVADQVRLATNFRSKVIGIALKDRGAILPAGHSANAAYWFDNASGGWITSTYYTPELPDWMKRFNDKKMPDRYMSADWNTLLPIESYVQSSADDKLYEGNLNGEDQQFPHSLSKLTKNKYDVFRYTPFANTYTFEAGKAAIEGESLGKDEFTDVLALSFSSTDYIGHTFGPNSIEMEDTYLRLDRDLDEFLRYLDAKVGKGQYMLFVSADHGAAHVPGFLNENRIPGGYIGEREIRDRLNAGLQKELNVQNAILDITNYQIYLNYQVVNAENVDRIERVVVKELLKLPQVSQAFSLRDIASVPLPLKVRERVRNGFNQKLSGDIQFVLMPGFFNGGSKGTTHGAWNSYDAHIPLLWYGWQIPHGRSSKEVYMSDIAPTIAALLGIEFTSASVGDPLFGSASR